MVTARIFYSNKSQAVRLPKSVAFPEGVDEVEVIVEGRTRILVPVDQSWAEWFAHGPHVSDDFPDREQPPWDERDERKWWYE